MRLKKIATFSVRCHKHGPGTQIKTYMQALLLIVMVRASLVVMLAVIRTT